VSESIVVEPVRTLWTSAGKVTFSHLVLPADARPQQPLADVSEGLSS